jgi:hypothetical protein
MFPPNSFLVAKAQFNSFGSAHMEVSIVAQ